MRLTCLRRVAAPAMALAVLGGTGITTVAADTLTTTAAAEAAPLYKLPTFVNPARVAGRLVTGTATTKPVIPRGMKAGTDVELMEQMNVDGKTVWRTLAGRPGYQTRVTANGGNASIPVDQVVGDGVLVRGRWVLMDSKGRRISTGDWQNGTPTGIKRPPPVLKPARVPAGCTHRVVPFKANASLTTAVGYVIMDCPGNRSIRPDAVTINTYKCRLPHAGGTLPCLGYDHITEKTRPVPAARAAQVTGQPWHPQALVVEVTTPITWNRNTRMRLVAQMDYEQLPHPPLVRAILRFNGQSDSFVRGAYDD